MPCSHLLQQVEMNDLLAQIPPKYKWYRQCDRTLQRLLLFAVRAATEPSSSWICRQMGSSPAGTQIGKPLSSFCGTQILKRLQAACPLSTGLRTLL